VQTLYAELVEQAVAVQDEYRTAQQAMNALLTRRRQILHDLVVAAPGGVTMQAIAREVGINVGSLSMAHAKVATRAAQAQRWEATAAGQRAPAADV